jgi:hypothetical protein
VDFFVNRKQMLEKWNAYTKEIILLYEMLALLFSLFHVIFNGYIFIGLFVQVILLEFNKNNLIDGSKWDLTLKHKQFK